MNNVVTLVLYSAVFSTAPWFYKRFISHTADLNQINHGFKLVQAVRDIGHVLTMTMVFFSRHYLVIPELVLFYLCLDVSLHPDVFRLNRWYLAHHILSGGLLICTMFHPETLPIVTRIVFALESALLPISMLVLTDPSFTSHKICMLLRPAWYFASRVYALWQSRLLDANVTAYIFVCPLLVHNSNVFRKQCVKAWRARTISART